MQKILVIGSSNIDYVVSADTLPVPGETLLGNDFTVFPGGKGANQAVSCGLLGGDTTFITSLGNSIDTGLLETMFKKANLDTTASQRVATHTTGAAYITVDKKGENTIIVIPGANSLCTKEYLIERKTYIDRSDIILLQLEIPYDAVEWVVRYAHRAGKTIILNPAPMKEQVEFSFLQLIDYLTPNETELHRLSNMPVGSIEEVEAAAQSLLQQGVQTVIVTIGKQGALLVNDEGTAQFIPPDIAVVDTTAAGDTFNGALAVALAEGKSISEAIEFANHAATLTVSRRGAQSSIPARIEVEAYMKELSHDA